MPIRHSRLLMPCLTAVLLAGGIASYAQTGSVQTDTYLANLKQENARHKKALKKIEDEKDQADQQRVEAENKCRLKTGEAKKTCLDTAKSDYDNAMTPIMDEAKEEDTLNKKNIRALEHTADVLCTGPDCATALQKRTNCTDGICQP
jgi:hypothetical protein